MNIINKVILNDSASIKKAMEIIDTGNYMDKKIEFMKVYESEIGGHPFPRSERNIRALGTSRDATCGCDYAESFVLLKGIQ